MSYPKEIYEKGHKTLNERRNQNRNLQVRRRNEIQTKLPKAISILNEISTTSARIATSIVRASGDVSMNIERIKNFNLQKQAEFSTLMKQNGYSANYLENIYNCTKCHDTGYFQNKPCECFSSILKNLMYQRLGANFNMGNYTFDNFNLECYSSTKEAGKSQSAREYMTNLVEKIKLYTINFSLASRSMFFYGNPGTGKTHLSIAVAYVAIEKGFDVLYVTFHSLVTRLEAAKFSKNNEEYGEILKIITQCEFLILDDLGTEFTGPFSISTLYDIVNTRLVSGLPTIINSNLDAIQLEARYSSRISSRIIGNYVSVPFRGSDIRLKNNEWGKTW